MPWIVTPTLIPITAATTARLHSLGVLLEYHALTKTDGAKACGSVYVSKYFLVKIIRRKPTPLVSRKQEKYATCRCFKTSIIPRITKPVSAVAKAIHLAFRVLGVRFSLTWMLRPTYTQSLQLSGAGSC